VKDLWMPMSSSAGSAPMAGVLGDIAFDLVLPQEKKTAGRSPPLKAC